MPLSPSAILAKYPCRFFFAGGFILIVALQVILAKPIFNTMLLDSVRSTSVKWAAHVTNNLDYWTLGEAPDGMDHRHNHERRAHVVGAIAAALETGTIHQVDLIRLDCMCAVSLGQGLARQGSEGNQVSINNALDFLFEGRLPAGRVIGYGDELIELDADVLASTTASGTPSLRLLPSANHAAAIFPSANSAETAVVVRLLMNLEDHRHDLRLFLALISVILTSVSVVVFTLASRAILRMRKRGEMSEEQARFLAERDSLTGLFNRLGFRNRAEAILADCKAKGTRACLIQYDADNLKSINDLHGHPTGDRLLVDIANQINASFSTSALIGRLGSDEFAVLVEESRLLDGIEALEANSVDGAARELAITTSVGFAYYPDDGESLFQLMKAADLALISAKKSSQSNVAAYHSNMNDAFRKRAWEIQGIQEAITTGRLEPYYQPLVNARSLELEGFETLVRWNHPELGTLSAGFFQTALNHPETAVAITQTMLETTFRDLVKWRSKGFSPFIGLNVGEYDLRHSNFLWIIDEAIEKHEVPPELIVIEVTESAVNAANIQTVLPILDGLRNRGISIALDDFGTGTSSLTTLRTLPRTTIKIDKSFVDGVLSQGEDRSIIRALTQIGHEMDILVVAEGVEDEDQAELLRNIGVDIFQGHLYGKPMPAIEIMQRLKEWRVPDSEGILKIAEERTPPLSRLG